ncbi:MAG: DUF3604 domain-containing protein [Armatimonadota bacterium]|nr:DUF3604 domain-containing protein [Armatimonadota bacterium]
MSYSIYWGDIHNHNAVGYAKGSLLRSFEIAREHLDFFAHTGHSQWPDMPIMPENAHMHWVEGFAVMRRSWPTVKRMTRTWNEPGQFVSLLGWEFHSSSWGDYHILFPDDEGELRYFATLDVLKAYARKAGALLIPHHPGYPRLWRGQLWEHVDTDISPIAEIISEHGGAERDRGLHDYIRHSMGGRATDSTWQHALDEGMRLGCVGSTDDHLGFPGAWGEGIAAVLAEELTREAVFEALKRRRCYAVTGDRIEIDFTLNGHPMGSELPVTDIREIGVSVTGWDELSMVELIRNGEPIARTFGRQKPPLEPWPGRARCHVRYGWGPWATLGMPRTCDWTMRLSVEGGTIREALPAWQSGPYDEDRRDRVLERTDTICRWQSFTAREGAFAEDPTKRMYFDVEGPADATVRLEVTEPSQHVVERMLGELAAQSVTEFTGPFTSENFQIERLVLPVSYQASMEVEDEGSGDGADYYYVRVTQANGQMAWSSPIWVG